MIVPKTFRIALHLLSVAVASRSAMAATPIALLPYESVPIAQRCQMEHRTMTIYAAVAYAGYGLCDFHDKYTGGEALYRIVNGRVVGVGGGGGSMAPFDMQLLYHVPADIAKNLVDLRSRVYRDKRAYWRRKGL